MTNNLDYRDQIKAFKAIAKKTLALESEADMKNHLANEFADAKDLFCQFIGFCSSKYKDPAVKVQQYKLVMFYTAVALEGLSLGRDDGFDCAKSIYFPEVPAPAQSPEERDRLIEMSHSDADPGL